MTQSVSDSTLSPTPFSPFSSYSNASGVTSDDAPDLGAFPTVFRALNTLRVGPTRSSAGVAQAHLFLPSEDGSDFAVQSSWQQSQSSSLISNSSPGTPTRHFISTHLLDTESSPESGPSDSYESDIPEVLTPEYSEAVDQPSLGYLDTVLGFIASERANLQAQRDAGLRTATSTTSSSQYRHVTQPRRKRRRKKNRSYALISNEQDNTTDTAHDDPDLSSSSFDISTSSAQYKSTPASPPPRRVHSLHHSKSTPSLRLPVSFDAHVLQLRNLAHKLRLLYPQDAASLSTILSSTQTSSSFADPRGPSPQSQDTLIHVFIDHSNILIGFISYLRTHRFINAKHKRLSHAALALILERGRPVTRRVLVTSSPLYQPMDIAEQLGYEVRIYARVPDTGDGADRQYAYYNTRGEMRTRGRKAAYSRSPARRQNGQKSSSNESDQAPTRVRYREQGVDELLQLKLHQAIAAVDAAPPGATIVLATGDGNVGQFSDEGFRGCVRVALKKGWRVELYAWEGGLSRAWMREFGGEEAHFQVYTLDRFAQDLLEVQ